MTRKSSRLNINEDLKLEAYIIYHPCEMFRKICAGIFKGIVCNYYNIPESYINDYNIIDLNQSISEIEVSA